MQLVEGHPDGPIGFYFAGTETRPGRFLLNTDKYQNHVSHSMMALALHEGEPGHHLQFMHTAENKAMPRFRQYMEDMNYYMAPARFSMFTSYMEGWGLYAEFLGEEMGLYEVCVFLLMICSS